MNYVYPIRIINGKPALKKTGVFVYKKRVSAAEKRLLKLNEAVLPPLAAGAIRVEASDRVRADEIADLFMDTSQHLLLKEVGS